MQTFDERLRAADRVLYPCNPKVGAYKSRFHARLKKHDITLNESSFRRWLKMEAEGEYTFKPNVMRVLESIEADARTHLAALEATLG